MTIADIRLARSSQRAIIGRAFTAQITFGDDGDDTPTGTVKVTVTNAAGTVLVNNQNATHASGGEYTYALTAAQLPAPDLLTVEWDATVGGQPETAVTTIDVCASRLFTLARARSDFEADLAGFTDAQLDQARTEAEDRLELECGRAFTTRFRQDEFVLPPRPLGIMWAAPAAWPAGWTTDPDAGSRTLILSDHPVTKLRSITVDGTLLDNTAMADVTLEPGTGLLHNRNAWSGDIVVAFEHGAPVADQGRVCLILARNRLLKGPLDDRAIGIPVEGGGVVSLLTPGVKGSITGIPEVDVFIQRNTERTPMIG